MTGAEPAATAAAEGKLDIVEHLLDQHYLEVPFYHAEHGLVAGRLDLWTLPSFEVLGVPVDLSITRHVVMLWLAGILLTTTLWAAFRRPRPVPRGMANMLEAVVLFVRDDIAYASMGERGRPYLPFLLTVFFFVLFTNLLGLVPYAATATGNVSVTAALALCTFAAMLGAGIANHGPVGYFRSLIPRGVPFWLLPVMLVVELLGLVAKPFALCIRLFANMTAGHVIILALFGMIFMFHDEAVALVAVPFAAAVYLLEIFVALVQAFIFTLLSALFIGMAAHPAH